MRQASMSSARPPASGWHRKYTPIGFQLVKGSSGTGRLLSYTVTYQFKPECRCWSCGKQYTTLSAISYDIDKGAVSRRGWLKRTLVDMRHRRRRDRSTATSYASRTSPNEVIKGTRSGQGVASFRPRSPRTRLESAKIDRDRGCGSITKRSNESSCTHRRKAHHPAVWIFGQQNSRPTLLAHA